MLEKDFKTQTTELVSIYPFRGKGVVNDRLRFDVSGLAPSTEYILSYDTTTGTFAWSTPAEVTGIDTLYSADGSISEGENRTVTLESGADLSILGVHGGSSSFVVTLDDGADNTVDFSITDNGIELATSSDDGAGVTHTNIIGFSQVALADTIDIASTYTDVSGDYTHVITNSIGADTVGYKFVSTLSGTQNSETANTYFISMINTEDSDSAEMRLNTSIEGGSFTLELTDFSESFEGIIAFNSDSGGFVVTSTIGDFISSLRLESSNSPTILRTENTDISVVATLELYPNTIDGIILSITNSTIVSELRLKEEIELSFTDGTADGGLFVTDIATFLTFNDGVTYSHELTLDSSPYIHLDNTKLASDNDGGITGTGGTDVIFALPSGADLWNFSILVTVLCTNAGNGIGLTTGEAFVGWYGVGVNNISGTPDIVGSGQALGTAQADTGMTDAAITFTVGNDPDVLNVHVEGPTTAGTTSVFAVKAAIRVI